MDSLIYSFSTLSLAEQVLYIFAGMVLFATLVAVWEAWFSAYGSDAEGLEENRDDC